MVRRFGTTSRSALLALGFLLAAPCAVADIVWKVADEGPRAPDEVEVLGDESRTIAFGPEGDWELHGMEWRAIPLRTTEIVGAKRTLFFANGRFGALTQSWETCLAQLFVLRGDVWTRIWSEKSCQTLVRSEERLYVLPERFGECHCADDAEAAPEFRRYQSVSLVDGTVREEAPLPACSGKPFVLSGKVHLIETSPVCGGTDARDARSLDTGPPYPFYRLDEGGWTRLADWTLPPWVLLSTPNSLWVAVTTSSSSFVFRILTSDGLSEAVSLPPVMKILGGYPSLLEWNGRLLAMDREPRGNIYVLEGNTLVRLTPESPLSVPYRGPRVSVAGNRLFTSAAGSQVHVLAGTGWSATSGIGGRTGADAYLMGESKLFAVRARRLFRRDEDGWRRLPDAARAEDAEVLGVWRDRPIVSETLAATGVRRLLSYDPVADAWVDLGAPVDFAGPLLAADEDLYIGGPPGKLARRRGGSWDVLEASPLPPSSCAGAPGTLRRAAGEVFVFSSRTCGSTTRSDSDVYRVQGDRLVPAFEDLDPYVRVFDAVESEGDAVLWVGDSREGVRPKAVLLRRRDGGFETMLTGEDLSGARRDAWASFAIAERGGSLYFDGLRLERGRLLQQRGGLVPSNVDPTGRFATGDRYMIGQDDAPKSLLVPVARVRKQLAAVVDTTGHGGTRYRSELTVANLSPGAGCVAKLYAGAATVPARELPLGPGEQVRLVDPVPGFVGPLAVEFEGLSDDRDAWAAVRVFSPSEGGTSGTSILGADPGFLSGTTVLLRPASAPGSRLHLAFSTTRDGSDLGTLFRVDPRQVPAAISDGLFPAGRFVQYDVEASKVFGPLWIEASTPWLGPKEDARNDLLGYFVRNDGVTNDGTVVPFEEPDVLSGRRTRFLPAVVGVTSEHGSYRTELTFGRRERWGTTGVTLPFVVSYRDERSSRTFTVEIASDAVLEIPDAGAWLVANGVPIDPEAFAGTLTFSADRWEGAADLLVTAVVQARGLNAHGDYGVSVPVANEVRWATERAIVPGLREDASFRSNVALANPEPDGGPDVTLEVTLHQASDGSVIGTLPPVFLAPGRRFQLNRPLREIGYGGDAWAEVRRVAGAGRFVAYGVVNDTVTSDGTLLPMAGRR